MSIEPSDGKVGPETTLAIPMNATPSETGEEAEQKVRKLGRTKLAIIGFAPSSYQQAPFHDPTWEIWGLNDAYILPGFSRADRWFEIHIRQEVDISTRDPNHIKWLRGRRDLPIYMIRTFDDIPMSVSYPIKEVVQHFAKEGVGADYLTNSISYEIALAIYEKDMGIKDWQTIGVWGVDMAQGGAYGQPSEYCVGPETSVLTADLRHIPAKEVKVGDSIMAFDENARDGSGYRRWRVATIEKADAIRRPAYRIHLSDGTVLFSSQEHRWLAQANDGSQEWRETRDLKVGRTRLIRLTDVWAPDGSYGAGPFDGEGHLMGFGQKPNAMRDTATVALLERQYDLAEGVNGSIVDHTLNGGRPEIMRSLGSIRPKRLLSKFDAEVLGQLQALDHPEVVELEYVGEQEVIALKTSEATFIADGFASHNSEQRPSCEFWLGKASGRSIYCYIPPASDLLKAPGLYGYEGDGSQMRMKIRHRTEELQGRITQSRGQLAIIERNRMGIAGERALAQLIPGDKGMDGIKQFIIDRMNTLAAQDAQFEQQAAALQRQAAQLEGAADDCLYWLRKYTLPTFAQEILSGVGERAHAALGDQLSPPPGPASAIDNVVPFPVLANAPSPESPAPA